MADCHFFVRMPIYSLNITFFEEPEKYVNSKM